MSSDFEWQIDNDESEGPWHPVARGPGPPPPPRWPWLRRVPRWVWLAVALVMLAGVGIPSGWLALRVRQLAEEQRAAVLNVALLEERLLAAGDLDAVAALKDPSYPGWRNWMHFRYSAPDRVLTDTNGAVLYWGDSPLNQYTPAAAATYGEVRLDGERAELVVTRHYRAGISPGTPGQAATFDLSTTQYYRFAGGGWLHTGPPETVYARVRRGPGSDLRVLYPEVDRAVVDPFVPYLQNIAARACQDLGCPRGLPAVMITAIPWDLLHEPSGRPGAPYELYLPAPSLLGIPNSATGEDALFRLYAIRLVEVIATQAAVARGESIESWLAWELAHLGLEAPLEAGRLRDAARAAVQGGRMVKLLTPELRTEAIWLMLDFLAGPSSRSPLRTLLADTNATSLSDQLVQLLRSRYWWEWWDYLGEVAALENAFSTTAEMAAACDGQAILWDAATGAVRPLGAGADLLLWSASGQRLIAHSWRNGFTVFDIAQGPLHGGQDTPLAWAPDDEWIAVDSEIDAVRYLWHLGQGERIPVAYGPGWVGWSPDGRHLAYAVNEEAVYLAWPDASRAVRVADGNRATWSPDSRYLAVAANNHVDAPVYVYDVQTGQPPATIARVDGVLYDMAWAPAAAGNELAIASHDPHAESQDASGRVQVFSPQGERRHVWATAGVPFDLEWSPATGQLGWALSPPKGLANEIWLAALTGDSAAPVAATRDSGYIISWRWAPGGDWLAVESGDIMLVSADQQTVRHLPAGCRAPAWRP